MIDRYILKLCPYYTCFTALAFILMLSMDYFDWGYCSISFKEGIGCKDPITNFVVTALGVCVVMTVAVPVIIFHVLTEDIDHFTNILWMIPLFIMHFSFILCGAWLLVRKMFFYKKNQR